MGERTDRTVRFRPSRADLWDSHLHWFHARLTTPETRFWIIEVTGQPVGQIRYNRNQGRSAEVSVSIAEKHRGKGYGSQLIRLTCDCARTELEVDEIVAVVIEGNTASLQLFLRAGFEVLGLSSLKGRSCYRLTWQPVRNASESEEGE